MRRCIVLLAALALAACDIPTEAPTWEQEWQVPVPVDSLDVTVDEILPPTVTVSQDGSVFLTTVPGLTSRFPLTAMCGACVGLSGAVAVKPAFEDTLVTRAPLPGGVVSAAIAAGELGVALSHGFDFDPLRPSADPAAERGRLVVRASSNGTLLAADTITGDERAFPAGEVLRPALPFAPVEVAGELEIEILIQSPEGDAATLSTADELVLTLEPTAMDVSEAEVTVADRTVGSETRTVDMPVDSAVVDQIRSGALLVAVSNSLDVAGQVTLAFQLRTGEIQRTLPLEAGSYEARLGFTGAELKEIMAEGEVDVVVAGTVSGSGGTATVRPGQAAGFGLEFEVTLRIGSNEEGN